MSEQSNTVSDQIWFECANPILRVEDMPAAVRYYVDVLGFKAASWGDDSFTSVNRGNAGIYLSKGSQGHVGAWAWIGVDDVEKLHEELKARGARIRHEPRNYPWALEMHVEDPDGNILRMGSDCRRDRPFDTWEP